MQDAEFGQILRQHFVDAIRKRDQKSVENMLAFMPELSYVTDGPEQEPILHLIVTHDMSNVIQTILKRYPALASCVDSPQHGNTLIHTAIFSNSFDSAKVLAKLHPELLAVRNSLGETPKETLRGPGMEALAALFEKLSASQAPAETGRRWIFRNPNSGQHR